MRKIFFAAARRIILTELVITAIVLFLSALYGADALGYIVIIPLMLILLAAASLPLYAIVLTFILAVNVIAAFNALIGFALGLTNKSLEEEPTTYSPYQKEFLINLILNLEFLIFIYYVTNRYTAPIESLTEAKSSLFGIFIYFFSINAIITILRLIYIRAFRIAALEKAPQVKLLRSKSFIIAEILIVFYVLFNMLPIPLPGIPEKINNIFAAVKIKKGKLAVASLDGRLFVKDYATTKIKNYRIGSDAGEISFSPDGNKIAYKISQPNKKDAYKICVLNLMNENKKIFNRYVNASKIAWSPDSKYIYYREPWYYGTYRLDIKSQTVAKANGIDMSHWGDINQRGDNLNAWRVINKEGKLFYNNFMWKPVKWYQQGSAWAFGGKAIYSLWGKEGGPASIIAVTYPELKLFKKWPLKDKIDSVDSFRIIGSNPSGTHVIIKVGEKSLFLDTKRNIVSIMSTVEGPQNGMSILEKEEIIWLDDDKFLMFSMNDQMVLGIDYGLILYSFSKNSWTDLRIKDYELNTVAFWSKQTSMKNTLPTVNVNKN